MKRTILYGSQRTEEWFACRCGRLTASNLHFVMSKPKAKKDGTASTAASSEATGRMNYRVRVALEQITQVADREEAVLTPEMRRGEEREPNARMHYEIQTGNEIEMVQFVHFDELMIGCSPDGMIGNDGMIETKCGNQATHLEYLQRETVPPEYKWQVQGSLWVTGRSWLDFITYHPDFPEELRLGVLRVERDEAMIAELQAECRRFLTDVAVTRAHIESMVAARRGLQEAA